MHIVSHCSPTTTTTTTTTTTRAKGKEGCSLQPPRVGVCVPHTAPHHFDPNV